MTMLPEAIVLYLAIGLVLGVMAGAMVYTDKGTSWSASDWLILVSTLFAWPLVLLAIFIKEKRQ